jgi:uncharacterized membrane-anchored protein
MTRISIAHSTARPSERTGGVGLGHVAVAVIFAVPIVVLVAYLARSHQDAPPAAA